MRPLPRDDEELGFYIQRVAEANHMSIGALSGRPLADDIWLYPTAELLQQLASATGTDPENLYSRSIEGALGSIPSVLRELGPRPRSVREWCSSCGLRDSTWGRLNLTVLCPHCGSLLQIGAKHPEWDPPEHLLLAQGEV